ncbi:MAG: hypothetical protein H6671_02305 [Anaerolineaceae bacterium]|nr:hypothetical protein [Anaerolineaceae bacterium]
MVKQRHILALLIPGATLLLAVAFFTVKGSPPRHFQVSKWQLFGDFPTEMYASVNEGMPVEVSLSNAAQTNYWRETLSSWHGVSLSDTSVPRQYPLLAATMPGSVSFVLIAIGWFQTASP